MAYTLTHPIQHNEEIKKSRFIVNAAPIVSIAQTTEFIQTISDLSATHNCWAWKMGQQYRFNDDGEPTSTAGRPILSAIEGQHCDHLVVVVTRYFGGIKLGTGGLMRAYGGSVSHCLQQAELTELIKRVQLTFHCYYSEWPIVENCLKELYGIIEQQNFDSEGTTVTIGITQDKLSLLQSNIINITRGRIVLDSK